MDQARQRAERRARKHPLRQRFSSVRVYILAIPPVRRGERRVGRVRGAGASGPILLQDSECSFASDLNWSSQGRGAQDSDLRVRERSVARGVCPSNLVREIVSSGRTQPPARTDGMGLFRGKDPAE